jgi:hypothetical protein
MPTIQLLLTFFDMHRYIPNDFHRNKGNKFILIFFTFLHVSTDPYFSKHETLSKHTLLAIEFLYDSFFVTDHPGKNVQAFIQ